MRGTTQGQEHMLDDVESTRLDTTSTEQQCPRVGAKISRNLNPVNFEEHFREIDAAISVGISNLAVPPLTNLVSDSADNMARMEEPIEFNAHFSLNVFGKKIILYYIKCGF